MRTKQLALAAALTAAAFSANAAQNRMEPVNSPFTYEALGATPTLTFGRAVAQPATPAPKAAEATTAAPAAAPATAAAPQAAPNVKPAPARAPGATATSPFNYEALGATPHVELKKQPAKSEVQAPGVAVR